MIAITTSRAEIAFVVASAARYRDDMVNVQPRTIER
jgi:hypothetical protein